LLSESFPQAAARHLHDAKILLDKQRWDNAVYLAGYKEPDLVLNLIPNNEDYQEIAKRLCIRFSKIFNKIEEEVI
jgi:hypothetical protein